MSDTDGKNEKLKLFAYARVSTKKQLEAGTMENQERIIGRFMEFSDKYVIKDWFKDGGKSAHSSLDKPSFDERPEYNEMIKRIIENDDADGLIISKLDRIGRSVKQLVNLVSKLTEHNKVFVVVGNNIDTSTADGRLFFHILSAIAEYEAELIRERMAEGRERAMELYKESGGKKGKKFGRPKIEIPEKIKNKMIKWYNGGFGVRIIRKLLKLEYSLKLGIATIYDRLDEWGVETREPSHRKKGKKIDWEAKKKEIEEEE